MRNASGKMRNDQCGTNVIGRFEKPHDHVDSANYHAAEHCSLWVNCGMWKMQHWSFDLSNTSVIVLVFYQLICGILQLR